MTRLDDVTQNICRIVLAALRVGQQRYYSGTYVSGKENLRLFNRFNLGVAELRLQISGSPARWLSATI
jgi:hypothetical protein